MNKLTTLFKALSEEKRLRILMMLAEGEVCSCQISEVLCLSESTVSTHMGILKRCNLVVSRKKGKWVYYSLPEKGTPEINTIFTLLQETLTNNETVLKDIKFINEVNTCSTD